MLRGDADAEIDSRAFAQLGNDRRHLDGFRPRPEYRNHFLHRERYFLNDSSWNRADVSRRARRRGVYPLAGKYTNGCTQHSAAAEASREQ